MIEMKSFKFSKTKTHSKFVEKNEKIEHEKASQSIHNDEENFQKLRKKRF